MSNDIMTDSDLRLVEKAETDGARRALSDIQRRLFHLEEHRAGCL